MRIGAKIALVAVLLLPSVALAATITVDDSGGQDYTTIQAGVNAASSGDTVLVYDGTYSETVTINKNNITLKSNTEWGAVLDGGNTREQAIVMPTGTDDVNIIGFQIQNYNLTTTNYGVVHLTQTYSSGWVTNRNDIKYCRWVNNTVAAANGKLLLWSTTDGVIRGNVFESSNSMSGVDVAAIGAINGLRNSTVELNKILVNTGHYSWYVHGGADGSNSGNTYQYNYTIGKYGRFRKGYNNNHYHNIWRAQMLLHEDVAGGQPADHNTDVKNSLYRGTGVTLTQAGYRGDVNFDDNLFIDTTSSGDGSACGIREDSPGGELAADINADNNYFEGVGSGNEHCGFAAGEITITNSTHTTMAYNTTTGWHNKIGTAGPDLKISVWPFTKHDSTALQTDYPYSGGGDTSPPVVSFNAPTVDGATSVPLNNVISGTVSDATTVVTGSCTLTVEGSDVSGSVTWGGSGGSRTFSHTPSGQTNSQEINVSLYVTDGTNSDTEVISYTTVASGDTTPPTLTPYYGGGGACTQSSMGYGCWVGFQWTEPLNLNKSTIVYTITASGYPAETFRIAPWQGDDLVIQDDVGEYITTNNWTFRSNTAYTITGVGEDNSGNEGTGSGSFTTATLGTGNILLNGSAAGSINLTGGVVGSVVLH